MTLLVAGYWQTTYWAENYWMQDYWLEYGTALPPAAPVTRLTQVPPRRVRRRKLKVPHLDVETTRLFIQYLTLKLGEENA